MTTPSPPAVLRTLPRGPRRALAAAAGLSLAVAGCSSPTQEAASPEASSSSVTTAGTSAAATSLWDQGTTHTIDVEIDPTALADLLATYEATGEKDWASATVTIDGQRFENVGLKLKGNSSLRGVTAETDPATLPWRIRLDKYVEDQSIDGYTDFAVRPNGSESSLNEAVALDLLADAGLASQQAIATAFTLNGSEPALRLTLQNPDERWVEDYFPDAGAESVLYKVESGADWSYAGDDADYSASFDIDAGPDDYAPLADLLELLDTASDEELATRLPEMLDVNSFATYLALEDLIGNFDTIAGPGNNAYLFWDSSSAMFTVVAWDHDRAFGVQLEGEGGRGGGGGMAPPEGFEAPEGFDAPEGMAPPDGFEPPEGMEPPEGAPDGAQPGGMRPPEGGFPGANDDDGAAPQGGPAGQGGAPGASQGGTARAPQGGPAGAGSALSNAFTANTEWSALVAAKKAELRASLYDSGVLAETVEAWVTAVTASGLVPAETLRAEADAILAYAE